MARLIPVLLVICLAFAGCISLPEDPEAPGATRTTNTGGAMTARETSEDSAVPCTSGLNLPPGGSFCAKRVVTVTGTMQDIAHMEVALSTFNGAIGIGSGPEGKWGFVATIEARGATAEQAKANLDNVELVWSHEAGGSHFLDVEANQPETPTGNNGYAASLDVTMPAALVMTLVASTSNGAITVEGARTDGLALDTSNGAISARASVTQVQIGTSNGAIDAELTPTGSGRMVLGTSNGAITLRVPEDARHGYDIEGDTSNGQIEYEMRDGEDGGCPGGSEYYTPPCTHRTFQTRGFASRDIQSRVALDTSNGAITVQSA